MGFGRHPVRGTCVGGVGYLDGIVDEDSHLDRSEQDGQAKKRKYNSQFDLGLSLIIAQPLATCQEER
jgi:hypothetical protein